MWLEIVIGLTSLSIGFYYYLTWEWNFWKRRGVPQVDPVFPWGSIPEAFTKKCHGNELFKKQGEMFQDSPYYGIYVLG